MIRLRSEGRERGEENRDKEDGESGGKEKSGRGSHGSGEGKERERMDSLKAEIERKRRNKDSDQHGSTEERKKKYVRRGDLVKLEGTIPTSPQQQQQQQQTKQDVKKSNPIDLIHPDTNSGSVTPNLTTEEQPELFNISNEEAVRRLRNKGQPIRLYGESDKERRLRVRALELIEERTEGGRNELMQALEGVEGKMDLEALPKRSKDSNQKLDRNQDHIDTDGNLDVDSEVSVDLELIRTDPRKIYPQIYFALKRVLKEWEQSMAERPDHIRRSEQGKLVAATQKQSAEYLKPLFKSLRKRELAPDVLQAVAEIVHHMQTREYIKANDAYLRLSIGNAPWPIGVTMVGIHERSGREKIFSNNVAHVLNDEVSRKYIQSLKRILTFAQTKRPPDDLARKMG